MNLFDELVSLVAALDADGVEYALVGGLAVAVWGAPRATQDIDLLVRPEALAAALAAARRSGFDVPARLMTFPDGMRLQRVSRLEGDSLLTLDLMLVDANLEEAWRTRLRLETATGPLWVITREALIAMKVAAGRPQDVADIARLREQDR
jgi:hypothetical protein